MPAPVIVSIFSGVASAGASLLSGALSRDIAYGQNWVRPNETWGSDRLTWAYHNGWITAETYHSEMRYLGFNVTELERDHYRLFWNNGTIVTWNTSVADRQAGTLNDLMTAAQKNLPDVGTVFSLVNRELLDERIGRYMIAAGYSGEKDLADAIFKLKDDVPGASDLISFAVRDCFTPEIVQTFQYNKELPTEILPYMKAQGLGGVVNIAMPPGSTTTTGIDERTKPQWFDLYWWSHWQLPSIQQGYEMLQRLYPNSIYGPNPETDPKTYFSKSNLELLQKANDYPPFWRDRLTALSYLPLQKRDITKLYKYGLLKDNPTDRSLFHAVKALGYDDNNALKIVEMVKTDAVEATKDLALNQAKEMYKYGLIQKSDFVYYLKKLQYRPEEIELIVTSEDFYIQTAQYKEVIPLVKKAVINGDLSLEEARALLANFNIWTQRINDLIQIWTLEIKVQHRFSSAQQILTWFKNGVISEPLVIQKLQRLYYKPDEITYMITNTKFDILQRQLTLSEKSAKQLDKIQSQLDKQTEKAQKETEKNLAAIAKAKTKTITDASKAAKGPFTETNLKAFAKANYMTYGQLVKVLTDKGWLLPDIQRWILTFAPNVKGIPNAIKEEYDTTSTSSKP